MNKTLSVSSEYVIVETKQNMGKDSIQHIKVRLPGKRCQ